MLKSSYTRNLIEAGCDEAGRGCLAGPVFAASVILPKKFRHSWLNDSKKLSAKQREELRPLIEKQAIAWSVEYVDNCKIDAINILNASFLAMHKCIKKLSVLPQLLLIDGNRFNPYKNVEHKCIVKGDEKFLAIAAASILAKTYRDDYMSHIQKKYPFYHWEKNKGYPTVEHREAIVEHGVSPYHRRSFTLLKKQIEIEFEVTHPTEVRIFYEPANYEKKASL